MAISLTYQPIANGIYYGRSPIFYKYEGCTPSAYTYSIKVECTTGTTASLAEYVSIIRTPDLNNNIVINVNNIIMNYIRSNFNISTENAAYLKVSLIEYDDTNVNDTSASDICCVLYGYSNYMDGFNYNITGTTTYMLSNTPDLIYLPSYGDTSNSFFISFSNIDTCTYHINYTTTGGTATYTDNFSFSAVTDAKSNIVSIPCGYNDMITIYGKNDVDTNKKMELVVNASTMAIAYSIFIYPESCNGNSLHYIKFLNKYGTWDKIFIKGKVEEVTNVKSENYKFNKVNYTSMTYTKVGSSHKYFTNGNTKYKVNTGWILESLNDKLSELLLSEFVFYDNIPVIVTDNNITYKTQRYDKLINYSFELEEAFNKINNII